HRVKNHCTENTGTSCAPCPDSTFSIEHSGLTECTKCTVCDPGQGLRVKTPCTRSSDTVCEPTDGYYCTDQRTDGCTQAAKHTKCNPGQYIKHRGTTFKDTECVGCENGTYSDGSFETCKRHSKCEDEEIKPGTSSYDTECRHYVPVALIVGVTVSLVVLIIIVCVIIAVVIVKCCKKKSKTGKPEAVSDSVPEVQLNIVNKFSWHVMKLFIHQNDGKIISENDLEKVSSKEPDIKKECLPM
ncbi:hypothetical protein NFI96_005101, partial [Prochilodus magdalenae]